MLRQVKAQLIFDECSPDLQRVYFQQPLFQKYPAGSLVCWVEEGEVKQSGRPYMYLSAAQYLSRKGEFLVTVIRD